jgi:hypothetical protein
MNKICKFQPVSFSWVAVHPEPKGVIEFLGGALFGSVPNISYSHFLHSLYEAGYTVITLPFRFGLDHAAIAEDLLSERDNVLQQLGNSHQDLPRFWVGHSLGCKYIILLEADQKIWNQPSLLIAPDISDTKDAVPIPPVAAFLDAIGRGVNPDRKETQALLKEKKNSLFNLTALISFEGDELAGNQAGSPDESDVALFIQELDNKSGFPLLKQEISGKDIKHTEIVGIRAYKPDGTYSFVDLDVTDAIFEDPQKRELEPMAIEFLEKLKARLDEISIPKQ